ncbi:recombinase family protein [Blastococcus sp. TF02A-30]|uniref:recombinase family protein n=1 Tax=Blastococcus sp. TF02A-30 TaxID=2250580 RepID=UPI000DEA0C4C|nr:recombinase family protein [Blastococcus sp. TF02A-30]RBY85747.1 hypothetical protein DQ241_15825 [Blastococcus sp. TF02A-30]
MPTRLATYVRISKDDAASTSIEKQTANIARLIGDRYPDAEVTAFVDRGVSASKSARRPAFASLSARLSEFDVVVFDTQDRIARRPLDFWTFAAAAEAAGTRVIGASEDLDLDTAEGELTAGIRLTVARHEARRIGARVKATNAYRRSKGLRPLGGPPVWGLMRAGDGFIPDPERGPILRDAIDRIIAGDLSIRGFGDELTKRGIPSPYGRSAWNHKAIVKILRSAALAGMTPTNGDVIRGDDGLPVVLPGEHLLTVDRWRRLQSVLDERARTRQPAQRHGLPPTLLHGIARDEAGHPLYRHIVQGRTTRYTCRKIGCTARTSVVQEALDAYVVQEFLNVVGDEPETVMEVVIPGRDDARLGAIRDEIKKTAAALGASRDPEEIQALATRLAAQRKAEGEAEAGGVHGNVYAYTATGRTLGDAYRAATTDAERVALLTQHIEYVVVTPSTRGGSGRRMTDRVKIQWLGN